MAVAQVGHLLDCSICIEEYSLNDRLPKVLMCGHTCCNVCLEHLSSRNTIKCPTCNTSHRVPSKGVEGLPTNHMVTGVLDTICRNCTKHGNTFRCVHCAKRMCSDCLDQHIELDYKSMVLTGVDKTEQIATKVEANLQQFVDTVNVYLTDSRKFCVDATNALEENVERKDMDIIEDKATEYTRILEKIASVLDTKYTVIDPYLPNLDVSADDSAPVLPEDYVNTPSVVFGSLGNDKVQFHNPMDVVVMNNCLYIADRNNKRICVHNIEGDYVSSFDLDHQPWGIAAAGDNKIVVSTNEDKLLICDNSGAIQSELGGRGNVSFTLDYPYGVATDPDGLIYICNCKDHRVEVKDHSGSVVRRIGQGELTWPSSVAVHPISGDIYVADSNAVRIYSHNGDYKGEISSDNIPENRHFRPDSMAFRSDGLLCIADPRSHCLHLLQDGRFIQTIGGPGTEPGQFDVPRGMAFTDTGDLVICDNNNHRIQVFTGL